MREMSRVEEVITLLKQISIKEFDEYILKFLERKTDKQLGLIELDNVVTSLNNFSFNLSLYLKQNYLLKKDQRSEKEVDEEFYTKKQLAKKYGVDIRTVTNWIADGLSAIEIGGVIRIGKEAVNKFIRERKSKKFNWKSIVRVRT